MTCRCLELGDERCDAEAAHCGHSRRRRLSHGGLPVTGEAVLPDFRENLPDSDATSFASESLELKRATADALAVGTYFALSLGEIEQLVVVQTSGEAEETMTVILYECASAPNGILNNLRLRTLAA